MSETTKHDYKKDLQDLSQQTHRVDFNRNSVSITTLTQMIMAKELKYIEFAQEVEEEMKLAEENFKDLGEYPEEVQVKAMEISKLSEYDPNYFERNKVDEPLIKPIQIVKTIQSKLEEAKTKKWKVEYYQRLRNDLVAHRNAMINALPPFKKFIYKLNKAFSSK